MSANISEVSAITENQSESIEKLYLEFDRVNKHGSEIVKWTCKMKEAANKHYTHFQCYMFCAVSGILGFFVWAMWDDMPKRLNVFIGLAASMYGFAGYLILGFRQKTVFNYSLYRNAGKCESYLNFPSWLGGVFKGIAIVAVLICFGMAVAMGSFAPLIGAGALGLGYAGRLMGWKNEVNVELSKPWSEHAFMTLDYKRKIIVTHYSNILYGFELRFPNQVLFDEVLEFLKTVLPQDIEILEKDWDAHDACRLDS